MTNLDLFQLGLEDMFEDVVLVQPGANPPVGPFDNFGKFVPSGAMISVTCRCKGGSFKVMGKDGKEVDSTIHFVADGIYGLTEDMQYTLPADFSPRSPLYPIRVVHIRDENGPQHDKVYFK